MNSDISKTAELAAVSENESKDAKKKKKKKKRKGPSVVIPIVTAVVVLSAGIVVSSASLGMLTPKGTEVFVETEQSKSALKSPTGIFLSGISVQGVDLGGRTMEEAQELLCIAESELIPSINYTLTCGDKIIYLTEDDFEFEFDTVKVLNEAFEYSEYMRRSITEDGRTSLKSSERRDYPISVELISDSITAVCADTAEKVNVAMKDAHVTDIDVTAEEICDMFTFEEAVIGYSLAEEDLETQISTLINNKTYTADIIGQMEVVEPKCTIKDLKENLVLISMYTTYSTNGAAGNSNMATAMNSMNGSIIKSGETFSFNEKTGNSNLAENGYLAAGVIVNGQSTTGVGGGICQAATTIYNAAIRADMTVVSREPHTWPSTYVPVGTDAAIDYGNIDMSFRNDTEHEVYLICYMDGATLYAYIYGYKPDNFDEITVESWFTGSGGNGFGAAASRDYYKNGEVVKTEDLPSSYYSNGGGTSYAYTESPSGYVFERVFTDEQAAQDEESKQEDGESTETSDDVTDTSDEDNTEDEDDVSLDLSEEE